MNSENAYMYLFARTDLSHQQQIVQTAHAAALIGERYHGNTYAVLCGAKSEDHLHIISDYLEQVGIAYALFFEPDLNSYTAIATEPLQGKRRGAMKKFKLM